MTTPDDKAIEAALCAWVSTPKSTADIKTAMRAAIAAYEAALWQPIESAPKNVDVLVFIPSDSAHPLQVGRLLPNGTTWVIGGQFAWDVGKPTLFRPLPSPPKDRP